MRVTSKSLREFCLNLKQEGRILKSRVNPDSIRKLKREKRCHIVTRRKNIIGFGALWPTNNESWFELGTLWVRNDFRNQGLSGKIFDATIALASEGSTIFLITKSRKIVHEALKRGWDEAVGWQKSVNWQKICQPSGVIGIEAKRDFAKDCRLFYTILS